MTHYNRVMQDIIYQTDPRLTEPFNRYGCRVRCLLAIPEFVVGQALTVAQIKDVFERGKRVPEVIVNDSFRAGSGEHWLINQAFYALGVERRGRQVGWNDAHVASRNWQYMIGHWKTDGPDGHFTLFDRREVEIFDPWNPAQANGYEINKQKIIRRLVYATWGIS